MDMERNVAANGRTTGDPGDPCVMVIFGASGDLTKRKLIPALYNLAKDNLLSREFALVGFSRPDWTHEQFREKCRDDMPSLLELVNAIRGQTLSDQIGAEHEQDEHEGRGPGELHLVLKRHPGEVVDQHRERRGRLIDVDVAARPEPVVAEERREQQRRGFAGRARDGEHDGPSGVAGCGQLLSG